MKRTALASLLVALLVVAGMTVPAVALSTADGQSATAGDTGASAAMAAQENTSETNESVNVTVGQQLSTILSVSSDEVQTDFENTAFELSVERESDEERAEAITDRAAELRERAEEIREDYEEATEAFEDGDIDRSTYAQRLAALNGRAGNLLESVDRLESQAANVSALELRAAGFNRTALANAIESVGAVNGTGPAALLRQFTGEARGEIEIETDGGLAIEVESEDGEQSREFERLRDDNRSITVPQTDALEAARSALSTPANGSWVLVESTVKQYDGAYEFEFALRNAPGQTGEAEVRVDGSSGAVYRLEEEIEARDDDEDEGEREDEDEREDEREDEDDERELSLLVADGATAPNATVTLQVLADGEPASNVTVSLNDRTVGTTDESGELQVTLPATGEAELAARQGESEGELEFEFEDEPDDVFRNLNVAASLDGDTVTTTVTYDGASVPNATVSGNGQPVGTTDADGTVTFTIAANETEDLELEIVKGEFEAELTYTVQNGDLVQTQSAQAGDGEQEAEDEREDEDEQEEEAEDEADDEEDEDEDEQEEEAEDEADDEETTETPEDEEDDDDD